MESDAKEHPQTTTVCTDNVDGDWRSVRPARLDGRNGSASLDETGRDNFRSELQRVLNARQVPGGQLRDRAFEMLARTEPCPPVRLDECLPNGWRYFAVDPSAEEPNLCPLGLMSARIADQFRDDSIVAVLIYANEWDPSLAAVVDRFVPDQVQRFASSTRAGWSLEIAGAGLSDLVAALARQGVSPQLALSDSHLYLTDIDWSHGIFATSDDTEWSGGEMESAQSFGEFARRTFLEPDTIIVS